MKVSLYLKISAAAMAAALTLTACGTAPQPSSNTPVGDAAMGRYVEQSCEFPAPSMQVLGLSRLPDNSVQIFAYVPDKEEVQLLTSTDGRTWTQAPSAAAEASGFTDFSAIAAKADGSLLVAGQVFTEEFWAKHAELDDGSGYINSDELVWPEQQIVEIAPDGTKREIPFTLPPRAAGNIAQLAVTDGGDVLVKGYNEVYLCDGVTGAHKNTYSLDSFVDSMAVSGNRLALAYGGVADIFDVESGEKLETISELGIAPPSKELDVSSTSDDYTSAVATGSDGAFYFCNNTGLYRRAAEGGMVERLLDGSLVSLGSPILKPAQLLPLSDGILVTLLNQTDRTLAMKKYVFDESVPTLPDKELRVYSLKDNKTVRQAISQYQLLHPDTHVALDLPAEGVSGSDALRALNTELLAGSGPDVLILDGMPVQSYMEKKVLLPLSDSVTEGLLDNITAASRAEDGQLYALPARVTLPLMAGEKQGVEAVTDMGSLADLVVKLHGQKPDGRTVLQNCGNATLLNTLYPLFADTLYVDGKPDEAKLSAFLEGAKRITDLQPPDDQFVTQTGSDAVLDLTWNSVNLCLGNDLMGLGYANSVISLSAAAHAASTIPGGGLAPLRPMGKQVYLPSTLLGVNSGSKNSEAAGEFVKLALSAEIQGYDFADGLPVNAAALESWLAPREGANPHLMTFGSTGEDGETDIVSVVFPSPETTARIRGWVYLLDTPVGVSSSTMELLRAETERYFAGAELSETVTALLQKLILQGAE